MREIKKVITENLQPALMIEDIVVETELILDIKSIMGKNPIELLLEIEPRLTKEEAYEMLYFDYGVTN